MLNTDEKIERKSTGRAGQEQRLEDMMDNDGEDEKEEVQGKQDRRKICWIRIGENGKEEERESRTEQRLEYMWNTDEKIEN
jgi:hypothetical protein